MKGKRVKAIATLAVVWVMAFSGLMMQWNKEKKEGADYVTAFAGGDFMETVGSVTAYANLGREYLSQEEKEKIIKNIASGIGIDGEINIEIDRVWNEEEQAVSTMIFDRKAKSAETEISIVTVEEKAMDNEIGQEHYLMMKISINDSIVSAVYYEKMVRKIFEDMDMSADVTLSLKGCKKGSLSNDEKNIICRDMVKGLDGEILIGSRSENLYIVYGYTEKIPDYVMNGKYKTNINIAITYDEDRDLTWIYLATPVIEEVF